MFQSVRRCSAGWRLFIIQHHAAAQRLMLLKQDNRNVWNASVEITACNRQGIIPMSSELTASMMTTPTAVLKLNGSQTVIIINIVITSLLPVKPILT